MSNQLNNPDLNSELDLIKIIKILFDKIYLIIIINVIFFIAAFLYTSKIETTYKVSTEVTHISLNNLVTLNNQIKQFNINTSSQNSDEIFILQSRGELFSEFIRLINLRSMHNEVLDHISSRSEFNNSLNENDVLDYIGQSLDISYRGENGYSAGVYSISLEGSNPNFQTNFLDSLIERANDKVIKDIENEFKKNIQIRLSILERMKLFTIEKLRNEQLEEKYLLEQTLKLDSKIQMEEKSQKDVLMSFENDSTTGQISNLSNNSNFNEFDKDFLSLEAEISFLKNSELKLSDDDNSISVIKTANANEIVQSSTKKTFLQIVLSGFVLSILSALTIDFVNQIRKKN